MERYGLSLFEWGTLRSRQLQGYQVCTVWFSLPTALAECGCPQCGCPWCAGAPTRRVKVTDAREWSAGLGHRWWGAGGSSLAGPIWA